MSLRDPIKIPIAVLKVGETRSVRTDLEFPEAPVTFKLIQGNGPVHIHGNGLDHILFKNIYLNYYHSSIRHRRSTFTGSSSGRD